MQKYGHWRNSIRLGDRSRGQLRDIERNGKGRIQTRPVARHLNLPNHLHGNLQPFPTSRQLGKSQNSRAK